MSLSAYPAESGPVNEYVFSFTPEEEAVFRKPEDLTPSEWAARHIEIIRGSHQGPF